MVWQPRSAMAPPPVLETSQKWGLWGPPWDSRERTQRTRPRPPDSIIWRAFTQAGAKTSVSAYPWIAPDLRAASNMARASRPFRARGLVHAWLRRAFESLRLTGRWISLGRAMM